MRLGKFYIQFYDEGDVLPEGCGALFYRPSDKASKGVKFFWKRARKTHYGFSLRYSTHLRRWCCSWHVIPYKGDGWWNSNGIGAASQPT